MTTTPAPVEAAPRQCAPTVAPNVAAKTVLLLAIALSVALPALWVDWSAALSSDAGHGQTLLGLVASLIGVMGAVILWWQYVLGIRPILGRLIPDWAWTNTRHRDLGIYGTVLIALHPLLMLVVHRTDLSLLIGFDLANPIRRWVAVGQVAFVILAVIWITSAVVRGRLGFRRWKRVHYLGYLVLPLVFLHAANIGSIIASTPPLQTYWRLLIAGYVAAVIVRLLHGLGVGRHRYRLSSSDEVASGVRHYRLEPLGRPLRPRAGQFIYLQLRRFGADHPFTVIAADSQTGTVDVAAKQVGRFSSRLATLRPGSEVSLDGPYGLFTLDAPSKTRPVLLIAGGIGITPFVHLMREHPQVKLAYAVRSAADIVFRGEVESLGRRAVLAIDDATGYAGPLEVVPGRVAVEHLERLAGRQALAAHEIYICGPAPMMDSLTTALRRGGVPAAQIHTERFTL